MAVEDHLLVQSEHGSEEDPRGYTGEVERMTRLIDADALKEWLQILPNATYTDMVLNSIDDLPTIEAIPIEWIVHYAFNGKRGRQISIILMLSEWRRKHDKAD